MTDRLGKSSNVLIQSLKENAKNKSTQQGIDNQLKVWKYWAPQKGYDKSIEKYEPEALNKILEESYPTVCKKYVEDNEPDNLRVMVTATDKYVTEKERDTLFARESLKAVGKFLREKPACCGNKAKASGRTRREA